MKRITAPLRPGDEGDAVADLQNVLQQAMFRQAVRLDPGTRVELLGELAREAADRSYRDATAKALSILQEQRGLDPTGAVDERTAAVLNALAGEWGLLEGGNGGPDPQLRRTDALDTSFSLRVAVLDARQAPLPGLSVRAVNGSEHAPRPDLGEPAVTGADGSAVLRFNRSAFVTADDPDGNAVALGFHVSRDGVPLAADVVSGGVQPRDGGVTFAPAVLVVGAHAVVRGTVSHQGSGQPAGRLDVQVRTLRFGGDRELLGPATTDAAGTFRLAYDPGPAAVHLDVVTTDPATGEAVPLGPVRYAAGLSESLTLLAPPPPLAPEYVRLVADLTAQVGDLPQLAHAAQNPQRQDLTVLSESTGWDPRLIALTATSQRLATADNDIALDPQALYGLLRAGLPSDPRALAEVDADTVTEALTRARDRGVIDLDADAITTATQQFREFALAAKLGQAAPGSTATYGDLLLQTGLGEQERAGFAALAFAHRGDPQGLWDAAETDLGLQKAQVDELKLHGKLARLAGNSAPLIAHLQSLDLSDPADLIEQGFFTADRWKQELDTLSGQDDAALAALVPAAYEADTLTERVGSFTADLARKLRVGYPTQVVTQLVARGDLPVQAPEATATLLRSATAQGFVLGETPTTAFLATRGAGALGLDDAQFAVATQDLSTLHRTYQLSPGNETMPVLMALDLTSAYDIAGLSRDEFVTAFEAKYLDLWRTPPPAPVPHLVYRKAQQISSVTYTVFGAAQVLKAQPGLPVTAPPAPVKQAAQSSLIKHFPTMEGLFGSTDYLESPHCRSVLGPAAYFVDLLQFIDPDAPKWANFLENWRTRHAGQTYTERYRAPIDVLAQRRPDLFAIELTCENTLTALPYIDVVNEILEYHVANEKLTEDAAHDTGPETTAELLAEPANLLRAAYTELLGRRHPGPLPFDLWIETVRAFCAAFDTPLPEIMEAFRPGDALLDDGPGVDRADVFIEQLGLSPAEAAILTDPDPLAQWWTLYGYPDAASATTEAVDAGTGRRVDLNSAKTLSRRLGVSYRELVDLVQTGFVNPDLPGLSLLYRLGVSIRDARHYSEHRADPVPDQEVTAFRARLTALAGRAGVPVPELEAELDALPYDRTLVLADPDAGADFDRTILRFADGAPATPLTFVRLAHLTRLWRRLGWTVAETDRALAAFVPAGAPFGPAGFAQRPLRTALIYLSHLVTLATRLDVDPRTRQKLATLWLDLPTTGENPLYAQLFLTRSLLRADPIFDHPLGRYLDWTGRAPDDVPKISDHVHSLQAALGLSSTDVELILADAAIDPGGPVDLRALSVLHRYGLLASMLGLPVPELITLKALSGTDPFAPLFPGPLETLDQDRPLGATLAFVELAQRVAASGLPVAGLDELLRERRAGEAGAGPVPEAVLLQLKELADGVRTIRAEHAVPDDAGSITDEKLRQELGLVLERGVVDTLMAMVLGTAEFADPDADVLARARDFFARELQKHSIGSGTRFGFLDEADFGPLTAPLPVIGTGLSADDELAARRSVDDAIRAKRATLARAFLPYLQGRLVRQLVVATVTARAGGEPALVEDLLTDVRLLDLAEPLLTAFEAVDGVADGSAGSFEAFLEVPATGVHRFTSVVGRKGGRTRFTVEQPGRPGSVTVLSGTAAADDDEVSGTVELRAGQLYAVTFTTTDLDRGTARLDVQSAALPRGGVGRLRLYPKDVVTAAAAALALIGKVLGLVRALDLSPGEVRHIATHADRFGGIRLGDLPTARVGDTDADLRATRVRFAGLDRLLGYAALKRELGGGDELLGILRGGDDPGPLTVTAYPILAGLTGLSVGAVAGTAETLWPLPAHPGGPALDSDLPVARLLAGLRIVRSLGVPADVVAGWTAIVTEPDPDRRFELAAEVKDAIRATLTAEGWQRVAQPVFDRLRARQRDALVAYVQQQLNLSGPEQLYEYFLVDPGMEPVVQTSRIRLATASVQQFIHRILLNLEPEVPPEVVNADQWQWMRRYRVWEANRKVFLYPENWLEPEFRDQKTHLFTALESALLEGDVSGDLVEDAFLAYLGELERIARLDVVAAHLEDDPDPGLRTLHVFGRTFGAPHAYYYRRFAHGAWTPWEPVGIDIQGDHLAPVIWKDRLRLFWVTFATVAQEMTVTVDPTKATDVRPPVKNLVAQLHWCDYVNGSWGTPRSGSADRGSDQTLTSLVWVPARQVAIRVAKEAFTAAGDERGVHVCLEHPFQASFYLQGRHSAPRAAGLPEGRASAYSPSSVDATRRTGHGPLTVTIDRRLTEIGLESTTTRDVEPILTPPGSYSLLEPNNGISGPPPAIAGLISPFFVQDGEYTLFGTPTAGERTVQEWEEWVSIPAPPADVPRLKHYLDDIVIRAAGPNLRRAGRVEPVGPHPEEPDWLLNDVTAVIFDGTLVHPAAGTGLVGVDAAQVGGSGVLGSDVVAATRLAPTGLGLVGGAGATKALLANVTAFQQSGRS